MSEHSDHFVSLTSLRVMEDHHIERVSNDGFVTLRLTFPEGIRFTATTLQCINRFVGHLLTDTPESQQTAQVAVEVMIETIAQSVFRKVIQDAEAHAKGCTRTGGRYQSTHPLLLDGSGTIHCQYTVAEPYQSPGGTPPAYQMFADATGVFPDLTKWSAPKVLTTLKTLMTLDTGAPVSLVDDASATTSLPVPPPAPPTDSASAPPPSPAPPPASPPTGEALASSPAPLPPAP